MKESTQMIVIAGFAITMLIYSLGSEYVIKKASQNIIEEIRLQCNQQTQQ